MSHAAHRWSPMHMPRMRAEIADATRRQWERYPATERGPGRAWRSVQIAEMYWTNGDMMRVALDASEDLPDWTPEGAVPADHGMLIWAEPLPALPLIRDDPTAHLDGGTQVPVDAVTWRRSGTTLTIDVWTRTAHLRSHPQAAAFVAALEMSGWDGILTPVDGPAPLDTTQPVPTTGTYAGLLATLGATWILMQQPTMATPRTVSPKTTRKWVRKDAPSEVTIIDLRRMQTVREDDEGAAGASGREYTHRWVVRGHWRQQAHGPGRSQRRPTWIPSYIKGPDNAPLLRAEHVHVWRR